jgi:hypothetical protein
MGECPVCRAQDEEPCRAEVGIQVGRKPDGSPLMTGEGAHLARLNAAPFRVKIEAVNG